MINPVLDRLNGSFHPISEGPLPLHKVYNLFVIYFKFKFKLYYSRLCYIKKLMHIIVPFFQGPEPVPKMFGFANPGPVQKFDI
jgi:hypothetical protein